MKYVRLGVAAMILAFASPSTLVADVVDAAYGDFVSGNYGRAFRSLFAHRLQNGGTLRVDFMLGVSACRLQGENFKAMGGFLLEAIPAWYGPLRPDHERDVRTQAQACPWTGITEEEAVARVKGSADDPGATRLVPERSGAGGDEALPRPPGPVEVLPPPALMSGLIENQAFLYVQGERGASVGSAAACAARCATDSACVAVTFVVDQGKCWLKGSVPTIVPAQGMVSAYKLRR